MPTVIELSITLDFDHRPCLITVADRDEERFTPEPYAVDEHAVDDDGVPLGTRDHILRAVGDHIDRVSSFDDRDWTEREAEQQWLHGRMTEI